MSFDRALLNKSNRLLSRADGNLPPYQVNGADVLPDGIHPRYQWFWSQELLTATPELDAEGKPKLEYHCGCGVDKIIHAPTCNSLVVAAVKFIQWPVDPFLPNCFVLCQWTPPPAKDYWADAYGSFRYYPSAGVYRPMSHLIPGRIRSSYIQLPYPSVPLLEFTERIVEMIRDHYAKSAARLTAMQEWEDEKDEIKTRDYTPGANSKWSTFRDAIKDKMTHLGERPGTKGSVLRFSAPPDKPLVELAQ